MIWFGKQECLVNESLIALFSQQNCMFHDKKVDGS